MNYNLSIWPRSLTSPVSVDLQLFSERGLFNWIGGLSLDHCQRLHWNALILHIQHHLHLLPTKCMPPIDVISLDPCSHINQTLLFSITTPAYIMLLSAKGVGDTAAMADIIFSRAIGIIVFVAFLADNQQWRTCSFSPAMHLMLIRIAEFYKARNQYRDTAKVPAGYHQVDLDRGFNVTGLFAWSRHPNFAAEQAVWITVYAWCAFITRGYVNWTIGGPICYILLFQGSTWLTELISAKKYLDYTEYQKRVGKFLPRLPGGPPGDFSDVRKSK